MHFCEKRGDRREMKVVKSGERKPISSRLRELVEFISSCAAWEGSLTMTSSLFSGELGVPDIKIEAR